MNNTKLDCVNKNIENNKNLNSHLLGTPGCYGTYYHVRQYEIIKICDHVIPTNLLCCGLQ